MKDLLFLNISIDVVQDSFAQIFHQMSQTSQEFAVFLAIIQKIVQVINTVALTVLAEMTVNAGSLRIAKIQTTHGLDHSVLEPLYVVLKVLVLE